MRITEDTPERMVIVCHQTLWIAFVIGLVAVGLAAVSISQRQPSLLWGAIGFAAFAWFFVRRDWLEVEKSSRRIRLYSLRPLGLRRTRLGFDDVKDLIFEGTGVYFRPALATAAGTVPLTAWYMRGLPQGREQLRVKFLVALGKLRPGLD